MHRAVIRGSESSLSFLSKRTYSLCNDLCLHSAFQVTMHFTPVPVHHNPLRKAGQKELATFYR